MKLRYFFAIALVLLFIGAAGDVRNTVVTDGSGNVITTPLVFSNQVTMAIVASSPQHMMRYGEATNMLAGATNAAVTSSVQKTGGTMTGALIVSNTVNVSLTLTSTTNNSAVYRVAGVTGLSMTLTNVIGTTTNFAVFGSGIMTNFYVSP